MTWQPIKTAPRDGQFFIGANVEEAIICNWPKQAKIDYAPGNWKRGRGREWDGSIIPTKSSLTHWQPLPDLPQIMTDLSPAAQAVLQAITEISPAPADEIAAVALRAAAEQCQIEWNYHPDYPETEWVVVASDLTAIADELEGQA